MKAKKRLEEIINLIGVVRENADGECKMIDVGTDHGWVPFECLERGYVNYAVCSDISAPSLKKAQNLIKSSEKHVIYTDFRVGDGLKVINSNEDFQICVIAGMGAHEIVKIINQSKSLLQNIAVFIFQTATDDDILPCVLKKNKLESVYDKFLLDGKHIYRTIMCANLINSTLQNHTLCGKLLKANTLLNQQEVYNKIDKLGIDFSCFGRENLLDYSKEHIEALENKKFHICRLNQILRSAYSKMIAENKVPDGYHELIRKREKLEKQINIIIDWCKDNARLEEI